MSRIEFRAPNMLRLYAEGKNLKPGLLSSILPADDTVEFPAIVNDFITKVQPPDGKQLFIFFLHGQRDKKLHDLIEGDIVLDADTKLHTSIR